MWRCVWYSRDGQASLQLVLQPRSAKPGGGNTAELSTGESTQVIRKEIGELVEFMKVRRTLQETRSLFEAFKTKSAEDRKAAVDSAIQHEADMSDQLAKQRKEAESKAMNNEMFIKTNDVAFLMLKKK